MGQHQNWVLEDYSEDWKEDIFNRGERKKVRDLWGEGKETRGGDISDLREGIGRGC